MYVIFWMPLVFSGIAAVMMIGSDEQGPFAKFMVGVLVAASMILQFTPALQESVHFLIPLAMQLVVCGWWAIASQFE